MTRKLILAGAQMGPIQRADRRDATLARLVALLEAAAAKGAKLVVFPELAFTTFFPRWPMERDSAELLGNFEAAMPNPAVQPNSQPRVDHFFAPRTLDALATLRAEVKAAGLWAL